MVVRGTGPGGTSWGRPETMVGVVTPSPRQRSLEVHSDWAGPQSSLRAGTDEVVFTGVWGSSVTYKEVLGTRVGEARMGVTECPGRTRRVTGTLDTTHTGRSPYPLPSSRSSQGRKTKEPDSGETRRWTF